MVDSLWCSIMVEHGWGHFSAYHVTVTLSFLGIKKCNPFLSTSNSLRETHRMGPPSDSVQLPVAFEVAEFYGLW